MNLTPPLDLKEEVEIAAGGVALKGELQISFRTNSIAILVCGRGRCLRDASVEAAARMLREAGVGTLAIDLMSDQERMRNRGGFDASQTCAALTARLLKIVEWLRSREDCRGMQIGFFAFAEGSEIALSAATELDCDLGAIVAVRGHFDPEDAVLKAILCPMLWIAVDDNDPNVVRDEQSLELLRGEMEIRIISGGTGKRELSKRVAELAVSWFLNHFTTPADEQ